MRPPIFQSLFSIFSRGRSQQTKTERVSLVTSKVSDSVESNSVNPTPQEAEEATMQVDKRPSHASQSNEVYSMTPESGGAALRAGAALEYEGHDQDLFMDAT